MNRRRFLLTSGATVAGVTLALGYRQRTVEIPTIAATLTQLESLRSRKAESRTTWSPAQVFTHLAQSVEYSLTGYPINKPALFQHTAGRAAFEAFALVGSMHHKLTEPIPGAPALVETDDVDAALRRLCTALRDFDAHAGALAPHFAFGALDHAEFAQAHVLHIRDHLEEMAFA